MTRGHPAIVATIRLLEDYAIAVNRALDILDDEWHTIDWHPASTLSDGMPRGASDDTPVERAVLGQHDIEADRAQLDDDARTLAALAHSALAYARTITARAPLPKVEVQRCNGKVNPACTEAAAEHRDHAGSVVTGMCSTCFMKACRGCYAKAAEPGRAVTVDLRRVPACEACARREWRQTRGAA